MSRFNRIVIIYNPNSTGDSESNARDCERELKASELHAAKIVVIPTKFKAHAEELVAEFSADPGTLIISSSGDGGYNEVINGVLEHGGKAATSVLPSGNANDHFNAIKSVDFIGSVVKGQTRTIDALRVSGFIGGRKWERYAHSYIGLGLTPKVGKELTEKRPNIITEKYHVLKHLIMFSHITIRIDGRKRRFGNLIFATIDKMSKVVKLDQKSSLNDGMMEVYETPYVTLRSILRLLFAAGGSGIERSKQASKYEFDTIRRTLIQLDGEVYTLDAGSRTEITCVKDALRTI